MDSHLVEGHRTRSFQSSQSMASLVIGRHLLAFWCDEMTFSFGPHQNSVLGPLEIAQSDVLAALFRCLDGGSVDQVAKIGAAHARRTSSDDTRIDVDVELDVCHVMFENGNSAANIWQRDNHVAVKSSWSHQGRVKRIGEVGSAMATTVSQRELQRHKKQTHAITTIPSDSSKPSSSTNN